MTDSLGPRPGTRNNSASLRRALSILLYLGEAGQDGASVSELCRALEMNKSTALRLLQPLLETRFVEQSGSGAYHLGWRNAQLGQVYLSGLDLRTSMHDLLTELVERTSETAHLVLADFPNIVYIDKVDSPHPVRMFSRIGRTQPAYRTSVGKAMLAHAPETTVARVVADGMPARTPNTITTAGALHRELARVRKDGYAVDEIENENGIRCVAAPIFDGAGECTSAVSVSAPEQRLPRERVPEIAEQVCAAAGQISRRLGGLR
ncbi:IclR family transcriptional regulator [Sciscionella marina]|uniref:IclR family transcriptional regulator n=1 Tax=Sciscionella marina TaxID=508770 RepID=UPI000381E3B4|nr:IclR family transcriptional regulator [Sciscionella marina]